MEEVGKILTPLYRKFPLSSDRNLVLLLDAVWHRIAGKPIAQHSRPTAFEAGTLTLVTNCPSWAGELRQLAEEIRGKINSSLGRSVVRNIRIELNLAAKLPSLVDETWQATVLPHPVGRPV